MGESVTNSTRGRRRVELIRGRERSRHRQTFFSVGQHRQRLFPCHAGEPLQEFVHAGALLDVLEQRLHRHARALEHPDATHALWRPLHRRASIPVKHGHMIRPKRRLNKNSCPREQTCSESGPSSHSTVGAVRHHCDLGVSADFKRSKDSKIGSEQSFKSSHQR